MSVLSGSSKHQAPEATPISTSSPRVDKLDEESGPPNLTSKSEAADADLDLEYDRMMIAASWRAHANLLMLFVRRMATPHSPPFFSR